MDKLLPDKAVQLRAPAGGGGGRPSLSEPHVSLRSPVPAALQARCDLSRAALLFLEPGSS